MTNGTGPRADRAEPDTDRDEWEVPAALVDFLIQCGLETPNGNAAMLGFRLGHQRLQHLPPRLQYVVSSRDPSSVTIRVLKGE